MRINRLRRSNLYARAKCASAIECRPACGQTSAAAHFAVYQAPCVRHMQHPNLSDPKKVAEDFILHFFSTTATDIAPIDQPLG